MVGRVSKRIKNAFGSLETVSFSLLVESYHLAVEKKEYELDWEEEQLSQYLVDLMKTSRLRTTYHLTIGVERKLNDTTKLPIGSNHPKKMPRIDVNIVSWFFKKNIEQEYFFEAKNLYEDNYQTKVASQYLNRYIDTGVENFRTQKYSNGSLVGYVLNGEIHKVVNKLNKQLKKDRKYYQASNCLRELIKIDLATNYTNCYESQHYRNSDKSIKIQHIFLKF